MCIKCTDNSKFPNILKHAVTLFFKNGCRGMKGNYLPASNPHVVSTLFQKLIAKKLNIAPQWVNALQGHQKVLGSNITGCLIGVKDTTSTQSAFTCSKLTIAPLEQGAKYVQS